jgi:hypothetical protein
MDKTIYLPNRFESVLASPYFKATSLIFPVSDDLSAFDQLRQKAELQQGGLLIFLLGTSGIGKTTAVYSASVHMPRNFSSVLPVPSEIELRDVISWLNKNLSIYNEKSILILFDGREITDDMVGLKQFLSGLNNLLRKRKDLLFIWPTTDRDWHDQIRSIADTIGGTNLVPIDSDVEIKGPSKQDWIKVLERFMNQLDLTYDDLAIDSTTLGTIQSESSTIGEFLGNVGQIIAQRITKVQEVKGLPSLVFIITSGSEVIGEANRIRRAGTYTLKGEELFAYSPRSNAGKWWKERSKEPEQHLGYIISLFDARLTTMTPSAVSYACLHFGEDDLKVAVEESGLAKHSSNAKVTLQATDLYRFLTGKISRELTSSRKGKTTEASSKAYDRIQELSPKRHKAINMAICGAFGSIIPEFNIEEIEYEVNAGEQDLYPDAITKMDGKEFYLEFHHISPDHCIAAEIASYIMGKLQKYAIHYNLAQR